MTQVLLIDGSNIVRRKLETGARVLREIYSETLALSDETVPIWCWEGVNAKAPRQAIFPGYKAGRVRPPDMTYEIIRAVQELLSLTRAVQVRVAEREADDCIAHLAAHLSLDSSVAGLRIVSNDADFVQLGDILKLKVDAKSKIEPRFVRLFKATVGDPSDNIPGWKGFGLKGWDAITNKAGFLSRVQALMGDGAAPPFDELRPSTRAWLSENRDVARAMWTIVGFMHIAPNTLAAGTQAGSPDSAAAAAMLKKYMQ